MVGNLTGKEIINLFNLLVDDTSELSEAEELALMNRVYKKIVFRPYEFMKKEVNGVVDGCYIYVPNDFGFIPDSADSRQKVFYVNNNPVSLINYSDRRQFENLDGYAYQQLSHNRLVLTKQPSSNFSYSIDYIFIPDDITLETTPVFPVFNEVISYGMAVDSYIIQQFDKARSYAAENNAKMKELIENLDYYNSNLIVF